MQISQPSQSQVRVAIKQIGQNELDNDDKKLLELPELETDIKRRIYSIKRENRHLILIGCILSKMSIVLALQQMNLTLQTKTNKLNEGMYNKYEWIQYISATLLGQLVIGFIVDLISLKVAWRFTQLIFYLGLLVSMLSNYLEITQLTLLGDFLIKFIFDCNYLCGIYILYDSSYQLKHRFNNAGLFIAMGTHIPKIIIEVLQFFTFDSQKLVWIILYCSIATSLIGDFIIQIFYHKIHATKEQSQKYQSYLRYRGVGISLKAIFKYYLNINNIYLFVVLMALMALSSTDQPEIFSKILKEKNNDLYSNNINLSFGITQSASILTIGLYVLYKVNSSQKIIATSYNILSTSLIISTTLSFILTLVIYFEDLFSFYLLYAIFLIGFIIKGTIYLLCVVVTNQLFVSLQQQKCSIQCIGLGFMGCFQDFVMIIYRFDMNPIFTISLLSEIGFLATIFSCYHRKIRRCDLLECELLNQMNEEHYLLHALVVNQQSQNAIAVQQIVE